MATKISPLQMTDAKAWQGLTTENHLGAIWRQEPQKVSKMITQIQQVNFGNNIDSLLNRFPTKRTEDDRPYEWELVSQGVNNIPLVEARINGSTVTAGDRPGKNHTEFELVFAKRWFSDVNRIVGEKNEIYPIQIVDDPVQEGTNWVYRCKLMTGDPALSIPVEEVQPGKLFSKEYSPVERTLSKKGGEVHFKSNITLRNEFSQIRLEHTTPGNMLSKKMGTVIADEKGNYHKLWTRYEDYMFDKEFRDEKNRLLMFGTSNKKPDGTYGNQGKSGYELVEGAGIREQFEASNTSFYNTFSIRELTNRLVDISEGKVDGDQREYVLRTGERGAIQFHEALEEFSQLFTPARNNDRIYKKGKGDISQMEYGYGGQFVEYYGPNGIKVNLSVDSMYDDRTRNKLPHPNGGPAESYRYDLFDIGTTDGEPNIQHIAPPDNEIYGYQAGLRDPFSPNGEYSQMSTSVDGYTMHRMYIGGAMVKDPSKTASFIPSILSS